jgi:sterol 3beta-glucosyltransferase
MQIALIALGSLGDVYPFAALGQGLQAAGYEALLVTHAPFEHIARSRGLQFHPIANDPQELLQNEVGQSWLDTGGNARRFFRQFGRIAQSVIQQSTIDCWQAVQDADAIIYSTMALCIARPLADKRGIPSCMAAMYPLAPTSAFASPYLPTAPVWLPLGGTYNCLTHKLLIQSFWLLLRSASNQALAEIVGLSPRDAGWLPRLVRRERLDILYAYSPAFVPPPRDWLPFNHVTGYWFLSRQDTWQPPTDLLNFLASGPPPVYVGFGSMHNRNPRAATHLVIKALERSGQRGILFSGWGGLDNADLPASVFSIDVMPHDWLFPQMAAIVHHGGSGTTGAALRAGIPSIITPFFGDQPFWGARIFAQGLGPKPISRPKLTAENLAVAIQLATGNEEMRVRASAMGERIRAEDGVARAVEILERVFAAKERARIDHTP